MPNQETGPVTGEMVRKASHSISVFVGNYSERLATALNAMLAKSANTPAKPPLVFTAEDMQKYWMGTPTIELARNTFHVMADMVNRRIAEYYGAAEKVAPTSLKPLSTYPEDRAKLLALANKAEFGDDAAAIELADMVKQILDDERYVESPAPSPAQPAPDLAKMQEAYEYAIEVWRADINNTENFKKVAARYLTAAGFTLANPPAPQPRGESVTVHLIGALEKIAGGFINSACLMNSPPDWHTAFDQLQTIARDALKTIPEPEEVAGEGSGI